MQRLIRAALLAAVALATLSANVRCSFGGDPHGSGGGFDTTLVLRDSTGATRHDFRLGEPIVLELRVRNRGDWPVTLHFNDARQFDFVVFRAGSAQVAWQWSEGRAFAQVLTELRFEPRETLTFRIEWNQLTRDGRAAPPGTYEARGALVFPGFDRDPLARHELGSMLEQFTLR
ncbi:MAG: BsuPI-related putative proteinase inhibitor [Steroidobacteraceae bacterium]|nr:BsuPI-related putative proteinase inhibitor [Steroidobacteraceae bacterium]MDW8259317.1 BsuPI-related putative proteinase inhibitor [Gammaproteobacteria bacterium]